MILVRLRYVVILAWVAIAFAANHYTGPPAATSSDEFGNLVPPNAPALLARQRSVDLFKAPILSEIAMVQRVPGGLSQAARARVAQRSVDLVSKKDRPFPELAYALPLINELNVIPKSREPRSTAVTYLFFPQKYSLDEQQSVARDFAKATAGRPDDGLVGVTGAAPALLEQFRQISDALPLIDIGTVVLIVLILGIHFRSILAPLPALAAVGVSFVTAIWSVQWLGEKINHPFPQELEPVMLVLLLGIVTDYTIFLLSSARRRLEAGVDRRQAAAGAVRESGPLILLAGVVVAVSTATLTVAHLPFFRSLGPALAATVIVGVLVSITLVPAIIATFGAALFWPRGVRDDPPHPERRTLGTRLIAHRGRAFLLAVVLCGGLGYVAAAAPNMHLGFSLIRTLPGDSEAHRAAEAASVGIAPGAVAPTELILEAPGIGKKHTELSQLEVLLGREPGVAGVIGPRENVSGIPDGAIVRSDAAAARMAVILTDDPFGASGIKTIGSVQQKLPSLLAASGLEGARITVGGDTALARETVNAVSSDFVRIAIVALAANFVLLLLFLRAPLAALYLLAASALGLATALGAMQLVLQEYLGHPEVVYYVPLVVAVLLLAFGSDYTIFVTGRIWQEAKRRPLREALAVGQSTTTGPVTIAGLALAASFGLLAVVKVGTFRELALGLAVGVLADAFIVRTLLVPALISTFGEAGRWPRDSFEEREPPGSVAGSRIMEDQYGDAHAATARDVAATADDGAATLDEAAMTGAGPTTPGDGRGGDRPGMPDRPTFVTPHGDVADENRDQPTAASPDGAGTLDRPTVAGTDGGVDGTDHPTVAGTDGAGTSDRPPVAGTDAGVGVSADRPPIVAADGVADGAPAPPATPSVGTHPATDAHDASAPIGVDGAAGADAPSDERARTSDGAARPRREIASTGDAAPFESSEWIVAGGAPVRDARTPRPAPGSADGAPSEEPPAAGVPAEGDEPEDGASS